MAEPKQNYVATVVRDDFFNDPFFKVNKNHLQYYFYLLLEV